MANARGQGRKPKPTAAKIRNGSAGHNPQRLNRAEPAALPDEPVMPAYLDDIARAEWERVTGLMRQLGYLSASYATILEIYCETYSGYRRAADAVAKHGQVLVTQKNGRTHLRRNPYVIELNKFRAELWRILSEFGLTPRSTARVSGDGQKELDPLSQVLQARQG